MPRVAWFSPIAVDRALRSAETTRLCLSHLPKDWEVEVFVDAEDWQVLRNRGSKPELFGHKVFTHHSAFLRDGLKPFDFAVHLIEDHPANAFCQGSLSFWGGLAVYHDLNLNRLEQAQLEHATTGDALDRATQETFGHDAPPLGDYAARGWSNEVFDSTYARLGSEMNQATVIVVESERLASELQSRGVRPEVRLSAPVVPIIPPQAVRDVRRLRRNELGISPDAFVIGFAGEFFLEERAHAVLEASFALVDSRPAQREIKILWITGDPAQAKKFLARCYPERLNSENPPILVVERGTDGEFGDSLGCCDVVNAVAFSALRGYPRAALAALARGLPVLAGNFGVSAEFPQGAVLEIELGIGEPQQIRRLIQELIVSQKFYQQVSANARQFIEMCCLPELVVTDYLEILNEFRFRLSDELIQRRRRMAKREQALAQELMNRVQSRAGSEYGNSLLAEIESLFGESDQ